MIIFLICWFSNFIDATTRINLKISPEDGVRENDRVTIFCEADGNPAPEVSFYDLR